MKRKSWKKPEERGEYALPTEEKNIRIRANFCQKPYKQEKQREIFKEKNL